MPTLAAWMINHTGRRSGKRDDYGRTYVVRPKGRHLATIVWLHGLGDNGARYNLLLGSYLLLFFVNFAYSDGLSHMLSRATDI